MKGLKVSFNKEEKIFGQPSDDGTVTLIISIGKNEKEFRIDGRGYDPKNDISYEWIRSTVNNNTKISVELIDALKTDDYSEPNSKRHADSDDLVNKKKVEYFHSLKQELEEKGLI